MSGRQSPKDDIHAALLDMGVGSTLELDSSSPRSDDEESVRIERRTEGFYGENGKFDFSASDADQMHAKLSRMGYDTVAARRSVFGR